MRLSVSSTERALPLTLEEVKQHLRVDGDDEDAVLFAYLRAETDNVEQTLNRSLVNRTVDLYLDAFPAGGEIDLPRSPVQSVTGVNYTVKGATGVYGSTVAAGNYTVDTASTPNRVVLKAGKNWPATPLETDRPVRVRYLAGYGAAGSDVPETIRTAILLRVGDRYWNRENTPDARLYATRAAERLLAPHRVY